MSLLLYNTGYNRDVDLWHLCCLKTHGGIGRAWGSYLKFTEVCTENPSGQRSNSGRTAYGASFEATLVRPPTSDLCRV